MNDEPPSTNGEPRSWFSRLADAFAGTDQAADTEELKTYLQEARTQGVIDSDTFGMIEGALDVSTLRVRDAMIPRGQMVVVPHDAALEEILPIIIDSGHSRFPVVRGDKDEVVGLLLAKDLLRVLAGDDQDFSLQQLLRVPVFIPESKRLNVLLKEFRASRNHLAIVVDEYGGVAGLITIEDVLEEIVGDIDDEYDIEEAAHIVRQANGRFTVQALTPIEEFNEFFDTEFSEEDFDTIGGLVVGEFGRMPERGETLTLDKLQFEVLRADSRRLHLLALSIAA